MTVYNFIKLYEEALHSQNWENVEPLFHPNAKVEFSNGSHYSGVNEIKIAFTKNFSLIKNEVFKISNIKIQLNNETNIIYTFQFFWQGLVNGENTSGEGKGETELTKYNNQWVILKEKLYK